MKKFYSILSLLILTVFVSACQSDTVEKEKKSDNSNEGTKQVEKESKVYKMNEEAFIMNKQGEKVYSVVIDSVKNVTVPKEDEEYIPTGTKQNIVITFTYKYINQDENIPELLIYHDDLKVYDKNNQAATNMDLGTSYYPFDSQSDAVLPGRSLQTHGVFSLKEKSDTIAIDYSSEAFQQNLTFELPVEKE